MRKTLVKMKNLSLFFLAMLALVLGACGAPFEAGEFTASGVAGALPTGSGAGSGGVATAAGAGGAPDLVGTAGSAGSAATTDAGAGAGGSAGAPVAIYTPPACASEKAVTGGYEALDTGSACLRTKETLDTLACSNWDNRSITVNGAQAACGMKLSFPPSTDGFTHIDLGAGASTVAALRWFLTVPTGAACSARWWTNGDLYAAGEVMLDVCDAPGSAGSCVLGKTYAFSCSSDPVTHCSSVEPGASGWTAAWTLVEICG